MQPKTFSLRAWPRSVSVAAGTVVLIAFFLLWNLHSASVRPGAVTPVPAAHSTRPQSAAIALPPPDFNSATFDGAKRDRGVGRRDTDIGLAENSWDFTAPDGVPGFGALDPADSQRLLPLVVQSTQR